MKTENKIVRFIALLMVSSMILMGCGQAEYYKAVQVQNENIAKNNAIAQQNKEKADAMHEERMLILLQNAMTAAAKTPDVTDDILVPMLVMNMESQRTMAQALTAGKSKPMQMQAIKAPDSFGDNVRKSAGLILGVGGIALGITQAHGMKDIAVAGINAAGSKMEVSGDNNSVTSDSYKNGTDNTVSNSTDTSISGKSCPDCNKTEEETFTDGRPANWREICTPEFLAGIPGNCSGCDSYYGGRCSVKP